MERMPAPILLGILPGTAVAAYREPQPTLPLTEALSKVAMLL